MAFESEEEIDTKGGLFSRFTSKIKDFTGNKEITKEELAPIMKEFADALTEKNVASEIAIKLCESVEQSLLKQKTKGWTSIKQTVQETLSDSLRKILTPK